MLRFVALSDKHPILSVVLRYGIAIASSAAAFTVVFLLQHIQVRDPYGLIFLAAIAVSFWYGRNGSGILAVILSSLALNVFLHSPNGWFHIAPYDLPLFCVHFLFAFWIYKFTRSRRRAELLLEQARDQLEAEVQARTAELTQLNAEYKTILNAARLALPCLGPIV